MPTVLRYGKAPKQVKNLGWLMRHAAEIIELGFTRFNEHGPYQLSAKLKGSTTYLSEYASYGVFLDWVNRPSFHGLALTVIDQHKDGAVVAQGLVDKHLVKFRAVNWS